MKLLSNALRKLQLWVDHGNTKGVPLPMVRDPKRARGSLTATFSFLSFNLVLFGTLGKITHVVGEVDLTNALWLFGISLGAYLGRTISKDEKGIHIGDEVKSEAESGE